MTDGHVLPAWTGSSCIAKMRTVLDRRRGRLYCLTLLLCLFILGFVYLGSYCPESVCALTPAGPTRVYNTVNYRPELHRSTAVNTQPNHDLPEDLKWPQFPATDLNRNYKFSIEGKYVLVFLHIQKTGGSTFGRHLVHNMDVEIPCNCNTKYKKKCDCENSKNHIWLFSRYSTGWSCGLHADWTELQSCVSDALDQKENLSRDRRFLYITILRDPVSRYLSEWKHVSRGATWLASKLNCNGRPATLDEVPFCFEDETWKGVTLSDFLACPSNLAENRQARMLANLTLVGCYNYSFMPQAERERIILESAKENLRNMAFFGLTEYQQDTQYMFEKTFHLNFLNDFEQHENTHASSLNLTRSQLEEIRRKNNLDIELYKYAKSLFAQRLRNMKLRTDGGVDSLPRKKQSNTQYEDYDIEEESDNEENEVDEEDLYDDRRQRPNRKGNRLRHRG